MLSSGENIRSAGTIKFLSKNLVEINNKSGHYLPSAESLDDVVKAIRAVAPNEKINLVKL